MTHQQLTFVFTIFTYFLFCSAIQAQELTQSYLNSLDDEPLLTLFDTHDGDSTAQEKIARTYLDRARRQKDTIKMARGYDRLARTFHSEKNIAFADSIIQLTQHIENITYPGVGYLLKAYELKRLDSFNNYFKYMKLGYDSAKKVNNVGQQIYAANTLIFHKSIWGDKEQALKLQRDLHKLVMSDFYRNRIKIESRKSRKFNIDSLFSFDLLISTQNFAHAFANLRQLDSARYYNRELLNLALASPFHNSFKFISWSKATQMEIEYYDKNFDEVIRLGQVLLSNDTLLHHHHIKDVMLFYGLAEYETSNLNKGISKLQKVDSMFVEAEVIDYFPYERLVYEKLLEYSRITGNITMQLKYLDKLLLVDSVQKERYRFFDSKMIKEYETPLLMAEKDDIIKELEKQNLAPDPKFYLLLAALTGSLCLLFYYVRKRLVYKKRFEALLARKPQVVDKSLHEGEYRNELSADVVEDILEKLNRFERSHGYLQSDITLSKLAKRCKTNSNYLSRVINLKREKNFSQYLHELRIGYAVNELLSEAAYRKYTIKAIAEECGYNNAESFSKAFYKLHGIYPSYYIKKVEKSTG